ncbi:MAG: phosphoglycolate phosphatase [Bdellovibrionales bacterium]|nr:phosphoglycolate phosphatase [Ramlibacter sp.]
MNAANPVFAGIEAVIVDLDGTMVDTMGDFDAAINLMMADLALPGVDRSTIVLLVGKGSGHLIRSVLAHSGGPPEPDFEHAFQSYQKHYAVINGKHSAVFPGVIEGLRKLQARGLKLACLTNKPGAFVPTLLAEKGLDGFFNQVFGGDAFERKKPDPMPLLKTCEALGTAPQKTLMIGDSSNDAKAARAAGCPVVLVTYGYNHGEPVRGVDADGFVDSLADLRMDGPAARP